jgi:hypothetical protein
MRPAAITIVFTPVIRIFVFPSPRHEAPVLTRTRDLAPFAVGYTHWSTSPQVADTIFPVAALRNGFSLPIDRANHP